MLLFAAAGGFVVFAVGEMDLLKAFIQGIGAPAMISLSLQRAEAQADKTPLPKARALRPRLKSFQRRRLEPATVQAAVSICFRRPTLKPTLRRLLPFQTVCWK